MELTEAGALFLLFVVIALVRKTNLLALPAFFLGFSAFAVANIPAATFGVQPYHIVGGAVICMASYLLLTKYTQPRIGAYQPFFWAYCLLPW